MCRNLNSVTQTSSCEHFVWNMLFAIENAYKYFTCNVTVCGRVDTADLSVILQKTDKKLDFLVGNLLMEI